MKVEARKDWVYAEADRDAAERIVHELRLPRILGLLLALRGMRSPSEARQFLTPRIEDLSDPYLLPDMVKTVERIHRARAAQEHVQVFGDYDVDGICSTALLIRALQRFGIARCSYAMPDRLAEGYGINANHVQQAHAEGVSLILTVDNGINAREAAEAARRLGIDLIVTDHHEPGPELPCALAVVDPKRHPNHAARDICGAGIVLKLAAALNGRWDDLDLAALGTIADVAPLAGENRTLVWLGLQEMIQRARPGLQTLARVAKLRPEAVTSEDIAFQIAPRINAGGRLADGLTGLELLLSEAIPEAQEMALELDAANSERRTIEKEILEQALAELKETFHPEQRTIVLGRRGWHPGVVGIVASRLQSYYYRPVILVGFDENGEGKGSGRSIESFNLVEALGAVKKHLLKYGGHQAAAGITVRESSFEAFRQSLEREAARNLPASPIRPKLRVDALVSLSEVDSRLIQSLQQLQPFGHGNAAPVFATCGVQPAPNSFRKLNGGHLRFAVKADNRIMHVIAFRMGDACDSLAACTTLDIAYTPQLNTWRGQTSIQLLLKDVRGA
jgi:single-stranded-DNA-specific exonuclease